MHPNMASASVARWTEWMDTQQYNAAGELNSLWQERVGMKAKELDVLDHATINLPDDGWLDGLLWA